MIVVEFLQIIVQSMPRSYLSRYHDHYEILQYIGRLDCFRKTWINFYNLIVAISDGDIEEDVHETLETHAQRAWITYQNAENIALNLDGPGLPEEQAKSRGIYVGYLVLWKLMGMKSYQRRTFWREFDSLIVPRKVSFKIWKDF